jgi:hypothetical protein
MQPDDLPDGIGSTSSNTFVVLPSYNGYDSTLMASIVCVFIHRI